MQHALEKIRPHSSSSLPHQKTPAVLLAALDSTFRDQKTEPSATAYFAALLTTLDGTIQKNDIGLDDGDVLPAELYLLALIISFVPTPVLRTHLNTLLALTAPLFPSLESRAPPLRSQMTIYHTIFLSLDRSQLETQGIRQTYASLLNLCLDPRPKVRKRAAEIVEDILAKPPAPLVRHSYAERTSEYIKAALSQVSSNPLARPKTSKAADNSAGGEAAIHVLAFLRPILPHLPPEASSTIADGLLSLPRLGNPYLSQSAYSVLADLFLVEADDGSNVVAPQFSEILETVLSSPPSKAENIIAPSWLHLLSTAMLNASNLDPTSCDKEIGRVWKTVWTYFESGGDLTRKAASQSLIVLCRCFSSRSIHSALQDPENKTILRKVILQISNAFDMLAFSRSIPDLLSIVSALLRALYDKGPQNATESLTLQLVQKIGDLRLQKGFEFKESVDAALSTAIAVLGPQVVLEVLPLNLEPSDRDAKREPRAFLLPLLAQPHPSPLGHFLSYFVPLSERMFNYQQQAEAEGRQAEVKMWSVLVAQVWSGLFGYCYATADLTQALTPAFSQLLSQLLHGQPELRPAVLKALKVMVDSNVAASSPEGSEIVKSRISHDAAAANVDFLRTQVESWLAVLFNVFGSSGRDSRTHIGEVITSWASIAGQAELGRIFGKVVALFKTNLGTSQQTPRHGNHDAEGGNVTISTQDILILLLPYLSPGDSTQLFELCLTDAVLAFNDNGVQKRGYKTLTKLLETKNVTVDSETVLRRLALVTDSLTPAAKKDRFNLLSLLVADLSDSSLHLVPSLIPEAVLGTKEPSDKARGAAFELILSLGRKMGQGGVVKRNMMDGMDEDAPVDNAVANIEEFLTMVAGGLVGATPHMISATVTAISRIMFEFKDSISNKMQTEIFTTLLVFLSSANREIVKSILGFIKLSIHTLPIETLRPHLDELVPALLGWSHDHKNHFKAKVRHIFERMLRRFGWDELYQYAKDEEASKVLVNIKKRKERAKRKKASKGADGEDDDQTQSTRKATSNEVFDDVLYGSESESGDSEGEEVTPAQPSKQQRRQKKADAQGARLRADDDEPMDLLHGAASGIKTTGFQRRKKPGEDAARFKTDEETGKMIIDEHEDSDDEAAGQQVDVSGTAYQETLTSVDGFTKGVNGRIKFNKDTKKRRREQGDEPEDVEMADADAGSPRKVRKDKKRAEVKLGQEFKAKRAGGDVKKGGVDPYAYLSLSNAAKKNGHGKRSQIGIVGKR